MGGYERSLRDSTAHLLCGDGIPVVPHPEIEDKFLSLSKCANTTDEYYYLFDASENQNYTTSEACELVFSQETATCFKISTAGCEPNFMTISNKLCEFECEISYTMPNSSIDDSSGYFYWSEKDTRLMNGTFNKVQDLMIEENFYGTSYKKASYFSLECNPITQEWDFIDENLK